MLRNGNAFVGGREVSPGYRVREGDRIRYRLPERTEDPLPETIPLSIIHEDDCIIVIDKPAGMTVHPVRPQHGGTLVNALLGYTDELSDVGGSLRRGIVHRLDRDTSGVMVCAKINEAHRILSDQFKKRLVSKEYRAIVEGTPQLDADRVVMNVSRHKNHPQRMVSTGPGGREAETEYRVVERLGAFTLVAARPKTGRTHQIRLAFSEMGHPIACDSAYGGAKVLTRGDLARAPDDRGRIVLQRQALHSARVAFAHPAGGERVSFGAPLAEDMEEVLRLLRGR